MTLTKRLAGVRVPAPGFGIMGMSAFYGQPKPEEEAKQVLRDAIAMGCTFWDTSDFYGFGHNEELIGKVLAEGDNRSKVFLATKFGVDFDRQAKKMTGAIRGDPEYVRSSMEESLKRLNVDYVDLYYLHRVDKTTPIEETVRAMQELRQAGKVRYLGLSECSANTLRRACKIAKIDCVQMEYSMWSLDIESNGVLETCRELGVSVAAYSPLGRGFLTGKYKSIDDFEADDFRRSTPRFMGDNFQKNLDLVEKIKQLADNKGCTAGQFSLAWLMYQGDDIIPIPGTKSTTYLRENWESNKVEITAEEDRAIRDLLKAMPVSGDRMSEASAAYNDTT